VRSESEPAWWEGPMRITWSMWIADFFFIKMENTCELCSTPGQREKTYSEVVSDLLKAPPESPGHAHHRLHIVADGEPFSQPFEEGFFSCGEGQGSEEFEEITKVVAADRQ
jgi:hypothetical protein